MELPLWNFAYFFRTCSFDGFIFRCSFFLSAKIASSPLIQLFSVNF